MKVRSRVGSCDAAHSILVLSPTLTSALDGARVIFVASEERDTCYPLNAGERLSLLLRTVSHMLVAAEGSSEMLIHHYAVSEVFWVVTRLECSERLLGCCFADGRLFWMGYSVWLLGSCHVISGWWGVDLQLLVCSGWSLGHYYSIVGYSGWLVVCCYGVVDGC